MLCRDVMTKNPECCSPRDTVVRAAKIMKHQDVGPVPVVMDEESKRIEGIITDRDIAVKVVAAGKTPESTFVSEVMSKDIVTCKPDDDYDKALDAMRRNQVRRVLIVDERGSLVGIISQADAVRQSGGREFAEVVEEISEPSGIRSAAKWFRPRSSSGDSGTSWVAAAAILAGGALAMYLFDPDHGRERRSSLAEKTSSLKEKTANLAGKTSDAFSRSESRSDAFSE